MTTAEKKGNNYEVNDARQDSVGCLESNFKVKVLKWRRKH